MNTLQQLNLSERDFKLLIDGLDALPERGVAGDMMAEIIMHAFSKNEVDEKKMKLQLDAARRDKESKKESLIEDVKILQGKLIMLKRYLAEQGALDGANDIINHFK